MSEDTKVCPECAEEVKVAARKCRFCGFRFSSQGANPSALEEGVASGLNTVANLDQKSCDGDELNQQSVMLIPKIQESPMFVENRFIKLAALVIWLSLIFGLYLMTITGERNAGYAWGAAIPIAIFSYSFGLPCLFALKGTSDRGFKIACAASTLGFCLAVAAIINGQ